MERLIVELSATIGDTIYYGNRKTGEINDFKINNISITRKNNDLIYEYYDMNGNYICNERDLTRIKFLGDDIWSTHAVLRDFYLRRERD